MKNLVQRTCLTHYESVRKGASTSASPPDVRYGYALPLRVPFHFGYAFFRGLVRISPLFICDPAKGGAQNLNGPLDGKAEPCLTSGGEAEARGSLRKQEMSESDHD